MGCGASKPPAEAPIRSASVAPAETQAQKDKNAEILARNVVKKFTVNLWLAQSSQTLRTIIAQPEARQYLNDFLKDEFAEQNLEFFVACQQWKQLAKSGADKEELDRQLTALFDKYLALGSTQEVNVSSHVRTLAQKGDHASFALALDRAQDEILRMMSLDCFPRFLRSSHMSRLQEAMLARARGNRDAASAARNDPDTGVVRTNSANDLLTQLLTAREDLNSAGNASPTVGPADEGMDTRSLASSSSTGPGPSEPATPAQVAATHLSRSRWLEAFVAVADLMPTCIVISDMQEPDYPMVYVNMAFCNVTGYSRDECVMRNCRFIQGETTDKDTVTLIRKALRTGNEIHCEILNYKKDGRPFRNFLSMRPVWEEVHDDATWERLLKLQNDGAGGSYIEGSVAEGSLMFTSKLIEPKPGYLGAWEPGAGSAAADAATSAVPPMSPGKRKPGPILMRVLPSAESVATGALGEVTHKEAGSQGFTDRVGALLKGRRARLAYFIGVQFEIDDDSLVPQRLVQHNALLQMLPLTVGF